MAWTEVTIDAVIESLENSLGQPESSVTMPDGSRVDYKTDKDKLAAIAYFKTLKTSTSVAATPRVRQIRLYSRGN